MESVLQCNNISIDEDGDDKDNEIETYLDKCDLLQMLTVPTFGKYKDDYTFLEQVLVIKKEAEPDNLPDKLHDKLGILKNSYPGLKPEFFHITLSTNNTLSVSSENDVNTDYTSLNLISHPYIFYNCTLGQNQEHRSFVYCAAFTDDEELDTIKEHQDKDMLKVNPDCTLDSPDLKREVILHLSKDGFPSLSPNNCSILINLNSQIINFYVVVCGTYLDKIVKCFVGNFVIIPNANTSALFKDFYIKISNEKNKENLTTELITFRNKYKDYMNYIFNFGINEIVERGKNLADIKGCLKKAFSLIYDFSINGDENQQKEVKIHEKEMDSMQNYYYNNVCNFIKSLFKNSEFDKDFGQKIMENSLKINYLDELLLKYEQYSISRINHIIQNYQFFIYKNDNDLMDIQEKAENVYSEEIFPNLKQLIWELLESSEETIDEVYNNYNVENRMQKGNPNIEILINLNNAIRNEDDFAEILDELDDIMKTYLFYNVWIYKGRPCNIHPDFGRVSFMNVEIDSKYFCSKEDKINCCDKLIEYMNYVDDKKY